MTVPFDDLPTGSTFRITGRVTATGAELLDPDGTVIAKTTRNLGSTLVEPVAVQLYVGDVVRDSASGDTRVVMWADEGQWSSASGSQPRMSGDGWVVIGHVDL